MGHFLQAVITLPKVANKMASKLKKTLIVDLPQGLRIIPMTMDLSEEIEARIGRVKTVDDRKTSSKNETLFLSPTVQDYLQKLSRVGDVIYLETNYFGGVGKQYAIMWRKAEVVFGLCFQDKLVHPTPISQALKKIGVDAADCFDEFDAIELHKYRSIADLEDNC